MDPQVNHSLPIRIMSLLLALSCAGATTAWAAGAGRSEPTAPPAQSAASVSGGAAVIDPCALSGANVDAVRAAEVKSEKRSPESGMETRGPLARDLWTSRIAAPEASDEAQASLALKRLIRQVRGLTFSDKSVGPLAAATSASPGSAESPKAATTSTGSVAPAPPKPVPSAAPDTASTLASQTQKRLDDLRKNAGRVRDPLEVAELLFLSGRPTDAAAFYEEALRRTSADDAGSAADRAWILFQLGNSLRQANATKAQDAYTKLIAEYPDSPWTEMARASGRLLTWYQSTRPDQLVAQSKP
jgi:tetratricopeptide (TPR) repeat protein